MNIFSSLIFNDSMRINAILIMGKGAILGALVDNIGKSIIYATFLLQPHPGSYLAYMSLLPSF